jgi:hypothetical protein
LEKAEIKMPEATKQGTSSTTVNPIAGPNQNERSLSEEISGEIDPEVRLLAAVSYGEASIDDDSEEVLGIAYAVANRARAWGGKKISDLLKADRNYTYAANGTNARFNLLMATSPKAINKSLPMRAAINSAINALNSKGHDPSNGAYWWDGIDLKLKKQVNPRIAYGFKYGAQEHNIFEMQPIIKIVIIHWRVINKRTGETVDGAERGRYDSIYVSTAARGKTIFWRYNPAYVKATGAKEYK